LVSIPPLPQKKEQVDQERKKKRKSPGGYLSSFSRRGAKIKKKTREGRPCSHFAPQGKEGEGVVRKKRERRRACPSTQKKGREEKKVPGGDRRLRIPRCLEKKSRPLQKREKKRGVVSRHVEGEGSP